MAKPTVKSNDAVPPASTNFKNNKTVKKGKAQEFNINIKQSREKINKKNHRDKILASDYFSASASSTKNKETNTVTEKVRM